VDKIIILGHECPDVDSIISGYLLEKIIRFKGYDVEFIIPDRDISKDTFNICMKYGLDPRKYMKEIDFKNKNNKYILVDHHERDLNGEIVCIIDHHPTNKIINIDNYYNNIISSTALYIGLNNEDLLNEFDLKLVVLATLIDTVSFHSTKGRDIDKDWVINICNKFKFDYDELYREGLYITSLDNLNISSYNGHKKYVFNDKKVESSYIQIDNCNKRIDDINKMIDILKEYLIKNNIDLFLFIVYDMDNFKTKCYLITKFGIDTKDYDYYASRGNTIMPEIEEKLIKKK